MYLHLLYLIFLCVRLCVCEKVCVSTRAPMTQEDKVHARKVESCTQDDHINGACILQERGRE